MPKFKQGDQVLINGNLVAEILTFDEVTDRIAYIERPPGGGTNTIYGHISQTRVEHLVTGPVGSGDAPKAAKKNAAGDELTTAG